MTTASLLPTPLQRGDTIGIIAPAGQIRDTSQFEEGVRILHEMGFATRFPRNLWPGNGYLADKDQNRAKEINTFFRDPEIKALLSIRGGYGCLRILDKLDLEIISRCRKLLIGFSDITVLQNYLLNSTGLVSIHGPVLSSLSGLDNSSIESFYHAITGGWNKSLFWRDLEVLREGPTAKGTLLGGNLASMITLLGTEYDIPWQGQIVFLEEINEPLYKIDRMFTQLRLAGKFNDIAGLILGDFSMDGFAELDLLEKLRYKEAIWEMALENCRDVRVPIWGNFPAGHCKTNLSFPLGMQVAMDSGGKKILFLQN